MPIEKLPMGQIVCTFGTGDVLIGPGSDKGSVSKVPEYLILAEQEPREIDVPLPKLEGSEINNWMVKLYFNRIESVNSFIHVLESFRDQRWGKIRKPKSARKHEAN